MWLLRLLLFKRIEQHCNVVYVTHKDNCQVQEREEKDLGIVKCLLNSLTHRCHGRSVVSVYNFFLLEIIFKVPRRVPAK